MKNVEEVCFQLQFRFIFAFLVNLLVCHLMLKCFLICQQCVMLVLLMNRERDQDKCKTPASEI